MLIAHRQHARRVALMERRVAHILDVRVLHRRHQLPKAFVYHLHQPSDVADVGGAVKQHLARQGYIDGALKLLVEVAAVPAREGGLEGVGEWEGRVGLGRVGLGGLLWQARR